MVVEALRQMRDNRVRSVLVIDDDVLVGIVTQGDCAIKGRRCPARCGKQTPVGQVMTGLPGAWLAQPGRPTGRLHGNDGCARLSPPTSAGRGKVVSVISYGDVVKDIIQIWSTTWAT